MRGGGGGLGKTRPCWNGSQRSTGRTRKLCHTSLGAGANRETRHRRWGRAHRHRQEEAVSRKTIEVRTRVHRDMPACCRSAVLGFAAHDRYKGGGEPGDKITCGCGNWLIFNGRGWRIHADRRKPSARRPSSRSTGRPNPSKPPGSPHTSGQPGKPPHPSAAAQTPQRQAHASTSSPASTAATNAASGAARTASRCSGRPGCGRFLSGVAVRAVGSRGTGVGGIGRRWETYRGERIAVRVRHPRLLAERASSSLAASAWHIRDALTEHRMSSNARSASPRRRAAQPAARSSQTRR